MPVVDLRGREGEAAVIHLLAAAQIHRPFNDALARAPGISREYGARADMRLWGYEEQAVVVGLVGIEVLTERRALIRDLAVREGERGGGVGRLLLDFLRGPAAFETLAGDTLSASALFYEHCGFGVYPDGCMPNGETRYRFRWPA